MKEGVKEEKEKGGRGERARDSITLQAFYCLDRGNCVSL